MPKAAKLPKAQTFFTSELFDFLIELRYNNNRPWFQANKARYEAVVRQPMLRFIEAFAPRLIAINPAYVADAKSLFRIYRDTRFSAEKVPYKTHVAAQFRFMGNRDVHAPGFYLHLEPEECYIGGGIWMPEPEVVKRIRAVIDRQDYRWLELKKQIPISDEDKLKRPPKGFEASHPLIEDLKLKSFITGFELSEKQVCSPELLEEVEKHYRKVDKLVRFLNDVLDFQAEGDKQQAMGKKGHKA